MQIYCSSQDCNTVKAVLDKSVSSIISWSKDNCTNINVDKTKFCIYGHRSRIKKGAKIDGL